MCEISERIEKRGVEKEREAQRKKWLTAVINLASYLNVTFEEAMNLLKIAEDDQAKLIDLLDQEKGRIYE